MMHTAGRTGRFQREADPQWAHRVRQLPGCERVFSCIQCGTCSGTCPLSIYMDYTPRRIIAMVREGFHKDALSSRTIWLCASCYSCAVHCPQNIHITDVMYSLKREAIKGGVFPRRFPIPILAHEFYRMVKRRGRISEFWLVLRLALRSNPLSLLGMAGSGWGMLRTGRLSLKRERIRGLRELQRELTSPGEAA
jgi:heterodisulfide reductase subunit C